jgi:hypothetical protein
MLGDFWYYRTDTGAWTPAPSGRTKPGKRDAVGLSCGAGQCLLANGRGYGPLKETWIYTEATASWSQLNCTRYLCPSGRGFPAAAYDPMRKQHVLFGGDGGGTALLDDTYTFAGGRWTARSVASRPPARFGAAAAFVGGPVNMVVISGGFYWKPQPDARYADALCDLWAWDGTKWVEISVTGTGERPCLLLHGSAWDEAGGRLVLAGGETVLEPGSCGEANRDVWYFRFDSATSGSWSKDTGSPFYSCASNASPRALMTSDRAGTRKVFFGGIENTAFGVASYANTTVCD